MKITIPEFSLVVLIGASGSGKSSFARKHFGPFEVISSDFCRGLVSDDENDQSATNEAFDLLHTIVRKRLAAAKLTVVDATNVQPEGRKSLLQLAREYHVQPVAIVLNTPERICHERNQSRPDRQFGPHVVRNQSQSLRRSLRGLEREGFRYLSILSPEQAAEVVIERQPLWNNKRQEHGPFDIVGDVHGCYDELCSLLEQLGYAVDREGHSATPPEGRKAVFVGDLVDRGPKIPAVLKLVMRMVDEGKALCVPGNHDIKLLRKLRGKDVKLTHGLADSVNQLEAETPEFRKQVADFLDKLIGHYVLDDGKLVVAHAGLKENMQGRASGAVREFALYGETTGETDEYGLPVRYNWAQDYRGKAMVLYGHTPVPEPDWLNRTINIDTGCVFGGKLTALRYPEKQIVSVPALRTYYEPLRPFLTPPAPAISAQHQQDDVLEIEDVYGKRVIQGAFGRTITIREENAAAALEVMSRFAADPKWIIYLPPTMSPSETSEQEGLLEHPAEAFAYFRNEGIAKVVCEEKHMGSRAVVVICRSVEVAQKRFGVAGGKLGIVYTRTGRRFFTDEHLETAFLIRVRDAFEKSGAWETLASDWAALDCELMPWSAKAQELLERQYAPVGAAGRLALPLSVQALEASTNVTSETAELAAKFRQRHHLLNMYVSAYGNYCWEVQSLNDLKLAPFHILATEGKVHFDREHTWHMQTIEAICAADLQLLMATPYRVVELSDEAACQGVVDWWTAHTARGGEGMVVKPLDFVAKGRKDYVQPAVKCRGPEYLRIIYGPEYTMPENLKRLRHRALGGKRSLAVREFALGYEALNRFVSREPLRRVHECVFGVLALESEPVDPRL